MRGRVMAVLFLAVLCIPYLALSASYVPSAKLLKQFSVYAYALADRPLLIDARALGLLAKVDPAFIHFYAYVGGKLVELPVRVFSGVEKAKFLRKGTSVKLYFRTSTPRYVEVWLPSEVPKCLSASSVVSFFKNPFVARVRELRVRIELARDPLARGLLQRLGLEPWGSAVYLCLYVAYEPRIPNPYVLAMSIESPSYVISGVPQVKPLPLAPWLPTSERLEEPIATGVTVLGRDVAIARGYEAYEAPVEYFVDVSPGLTSWEGVNRLSFMQVVKVGTVSGILPLSIVAELWANATRATARGSCELRVDTYLVEAKLGVSGIEPSRVVKVKSSTYAIALGKPNLVIDATYLTSYAIEGLVKEFRGLVLVEYEVSAVGCSAPIALGVDRVVTLYAKYNSSELDRMYEVAKFEIDFFGSKRVRAEVYPNGYVYYASIEGKRMVLDIGTGVSSARVNLVVPGAVGSSLVWRFSEVSIRLRIHLVKDVVPVAIKVRACLGADGGVCSSWKSLSGGETTIVSVEVPQPSLVYSLAVQSVVPLTLTIVKPRDVATELVIELPRGVSIPARVIEAVSVTRKHIYLGYSSIPVPGVTAPVLSTRVLSYVDTALGEGSDLSFTQSYLDVSVALASSVSLVWNGLSEQYAHLEVNVMGVESSLSLERVTVVSESATGNEVQCYRVMVHAVTSPLLKYVARILAFLSTAIRVVDVASTLAGNEEASLMSSVAEVPVDLAHRVAEHASEVSAYCVNNVAKIVGPRVGYLEGLAIDFETKLACGANANVYTFDVRYSMGGGFARVEDEVEDTVSIPVACPLYGG